MTCAACECGCPSDAVCRCDDRRGPRHLHNPSGLPAIAYRVGDFGSFRHDLVRHLDGERELAAWRPSAERDLALQVVDWWAYVADILTFYNERIANEAYLGTAVLPESVKRLVAALGYRPRPGIGSVATLAAIASGPGPLVLPDRFAVGSKAKPGSEAQTFELAKSTTFAEPTSVETAPPDDLAQAPTLDGPPPGSKPGAADPPPHDQLIARGGVLVKGKPSSVVVGDRLLLLTDPWTGPSDPKAIVTVTGLVAEKDPQGKANTRVLLSGTGSLGAAKAKDFKLKRATHTNHLVTVPAGAAVVTSTTLYLDGTARFLRSGDPLLVEVRGSNPAADVVLLTGYAEVVWYANADKGTPTTPKGDNPIALVVAQLTVKAAGNELPGPYDDDVSKVSVHSGWVDVGKLLDTPVTRLAALPSKLRLARAPAAAAGVAMPALLEDAHGQGSAVTATPTADTSDVTVSPSGAAAKLEPPLRLLWDLFTVTRGASVRDERLGTGDATLPGQDFKLAKAPVTYLADGTGGGGASSRSGDGYSSTIELVVDGVRWTEVPLLFGRGPDERVFSTYEDEEGKTHVVTGDGLNGKRLRSGAAVSASYRIGSGAEVPDAGAITQLLSPVPNLSAVRNPVQAAGGADPDPPDHLRRYAPRSVLTFGRAVSGDDYAAVAALAPGVTRAAAAWSWDPAEQRAMVRLYVGDDAGAVTSAKTALREESDPNRPVVVLQADARTTYMHISLDVDPAYIADDVVAVVRSSLVDGLFAPGTLRIGELLYRSRIEAACDLPGVRAVHYLLVLHKTPAGTWNTNWTGPRFWPGESGYFDLTDERLFVDQGVAWLG